MDSIISRSRSVWRVDLHVDHRDAAGAHGDAVTVVDQFVGELLGVLLRVAFPAGDAGDDQAGLAVLADQRGGCGRRGDVHAEVTSATWGDCCSCAAMSVPTARAAGLVAPAVGCHA